MSVAQSKDLVLNTQELIDVSKEHYHFNDHGGVIRTRDQYSMTRLFKIALIIIIEGNLLNIATFYRNLRGCVISRCKVPQNMCHNKKHCKKYIHKSKTFFAKTFLTIGNNRLHSVAIYTRAPMINSIVIDFNNEHAFLTQDIVDRVPQQFFGPITSHVIILITLLGHHKGFQDRNRKLLVWMSLFVWQVA